MSLTMLAFQLMQLLLRIRSFDCCLIVFVRMFSIL